MDKAKAITSYGADSIHELEGLEPVRRRPAMYIGDTGVTGLHHLVKEAVDNALDEAVVGVASFCRVTLEPDNYVTVEDDGRGIPVGKHTKTGMSALEMVLSHLHAGGKFDNMNEDSGFFRTPSAGLHGVGVKAVTALSEKLEAVITRDGHMWSQKYEYGKKMNEVQKLGKADGHGTKLRFKPDEGIFETIEMDPAIISERLEEIAYLQPGFRTELVDARKTPAKPEVKSWISQEGLGQLLIKLARNRKLAFRPIHAKMKGKITFTHGRLKGREEAVTVDIWSSYFEESEDTVLRSFVNNVSTPNHGTHVNGLRTGLFDIIRDTIADDARLRGIKTELIESDILDGLVAIVSVHLLEPEFEGQTKMKLGNPEMRSVAKDLVKQAFEKEFERNPQVRDAIRDRCIMSILARDAAKKAREISKRNNEFERIVLPDKLADCSDSEPEHTEVWLVEGESAGGSAKKGRDARTQAVLSMKGKVINAERGNINKMLENKEIRDICEAVGLRIQVDSETKVPKLVPQLRYGKIIIAADADPDGDHIRCLLMTLFFKHATEVVRHGNLYLACPPLYRVRKESTSETIAYLADDEALKQYERKREMKGLSVTRFKGLGEMKPGELGATTMDRSTRRLLQVTIYDDDEAQKTVNTLMGNDASARRAFIEEHSREVVEDEAVV